MEVDIRELKPNYLYKIERKDHSQSHWVGLIIEAAEHKDGYIFFEKVNRLGEFTSVVSIGYASVLSNWHIFVEIGPKEDYPEYFI